MTAWNKGAVRKRNIGFDEIIRRKLSAIYMFDVRLNPFQSRSEPESEGFENWNDGGLLPSRAQNGAGSLFQQREIKLLSKTRTALYEICNTSRIFCPGPLFAHFPPFFTVHSQCHWTPGYPEPFVVKFPPSINFCENIHEKFVSCPIRYAGASCPSSSTRDLHSSHCAPCLKSCDKFEGAGGF